MIVGLLIPIHRHMDLVNVNKENIPPPVMTTSHNDIIDALGVSKRLGNSVLDELDSRAHAKFEQLRNTLVPMDQNFSSNRFSSVHQHDFNSMESLDTHYAAKKRLVEYSNATTDVTRAEMVKENEEEEEEEEANLSTPKRHMQQEIVTSTKRLKDSQGKARESDSFLSSPVTDITRRIRRLRVNIANPRDRRRSSIRDTPLTGRNGIARITNNNCIYNYDPTLQQPTFAKPTFTSINRQNKPGAIFANLKKNTVSKREPSNVTIPQTFNSKDNDQIMPSMNDDDTPVTAPTQRKTVGSVSVFERLYQTSTVSRSTSSNKLSDNKLKKSQTMKNLSIDSNVPKTSNGVHLPRSRTSGSLNSSLPRSKTMGALATEKVKLPRSTSMGKPTWR